MGVPWDGFVREASKCAVSRWKVEQRTREWHPSVLQAGAHHASLAVVGRAAPCRETNATVPAPGVLQGLLPAAREGRGKALPGAIASLFVSEALERSLVTLNHVCF